MTADFERLLGLLKPEDLDAPPSVELGGALEAPLRGAVLGGRFEIQEVLGQGAMGSVVLAHDRQLKRQVALKFIRGRASPQRVERLRREAALAARIDHPHVVKIHSLEEESGRLFLVSEFVPDARLLKEAWRLLARPQRLELVLQIAAGIGAAHEQGVVHRDVKPQNVLVGSDGRARVTDFGVARAEGLARLTVTGAVVGTLRYMAPEQATGGAPVTPAADVWALGLLLFQALHDRLPFEAETVPATLDAILSSRVQVDWGVPRPLAEVCLRALEKDVEGRYPDANAFAAALSAARRQAARRSWLLPLAFLTLGLVLSVTLGLAWSASSGERSVDVPIDSTANSPDPATTPAGVGTLPFEVKPSSRVTYLSLVGDTLFAEYKLGAECWDLVLGRRVRRWDQRLTLTARNQGRPSLGLDLLGRHGLSTRDAKSVSLALPPAGRDGQTVLAWGPSGRLCARYEGDRLALFGPDGELLRSLSFEPTPVLFVQPFVTEQFVILIRGREKNGSLVELWSRETWAPVQLEGAGESYITARCAAVSPSGQSLALGGKEGHLLVWRLDPPSPTLVLADEDSGGALAGLSLLAHSKGVRALAFRDERRLLSSAPGAGELTLWDLERREPIDRREGECVALAVQPSRGRAAFGFLTPPRVRVVDWKGDPDRLPTW